MNAMFFGAVGRFVRSLPFCRCRALGRRFNLVLFALPLLPALFLLSCVAPAPEPPEVERAPEVQEVEEVARAFLGALSGADTAALRSLMAPDLSLSSVRTGPDGAVIRHTTGEEFLNGLGTEDQDFLERMWNPVVYVQGQVAMVWTPYDFFLNGEFSHCGIDVFTMLEGEDGWRVTSITYDVVREGCPASPLGPPAG